MSELNIYHFVQHIICQAKRKQESRDSQAVREIAALRSGMSITTEYRAYPYVLPYLGNASQRERMVALRCAAMIAEYADLGADSDDASPLRFGVWANHLARKIGGWHDRFSPGVFAYARCRGSHHYNPADFTVCPKCWFYPKS